jgi:hypothetical protein
MRVAEHLIGFFGFRPINPTHRDMRMGICTENFDPPRQFERDRLDAVIKSMQSAKHTRQVRQHPG